MNKSIASNVLRDLINNIYNSTDLSYELLNEIKKNLEEMKDIILEDKSYRELLILIEAAKKQKSTIFRNKFKYTILSNLEREYKRINSTPLIS